MMLHLKSDALLQGPRLASPACRMVEVVASQSRIQGSGFRVQGSGFRVQGSGFRV